MPCQGPSSEECAKERYNEKLQGLLKYLLLEASIEPHPGHITDFLNKSGYDLMNTFPKVQEYMCSIINSLPNNKLNRIVYNAKDRQSRDLANWWDDHTYNDLKNAKEALGQTNKGITNIQIRLKEFQDKRLRILSEIKEINLRKKRVE